MRTERDPRSAVGPTSIRPCVNGIGPGVLCVLFVVTTLGPARLTGTVAAGQGTGTERVLRTAAQRLDWPATISAGGDLPGQALQVTADGIDRPSTLRAAITFLADTDEPAFLDAYARRSLPRGLYHGWEAIIVRSGEQVCAEGGPEPPASCREHHGLIAWRCGPYGFLAEDRTGNGREPEIAEILYAAAVEHTLCAPSGSMVILAETADTPGHHRLSRFQRLADGTDRYYAANGYGRVSFDFCFLEAGSPRARDGWHNPGFSAEVPEDGYAYAVEALQGGLAGASLPEVVYLERAIVVYAEVGQQANAPRLDPASTIWLPRDHYIEVRGAEHKARIYVPNLVLLSEQEGLGAWTHELGHTLYARYEGEEGAQRVADRYDYPDPGRRFGHVGPWDLMGGGAHWGSPDSPSPTQMSSFTKVAAGWLRFRQAVPERDYVLTAVENQRMGDAVLKLDDPLDDDPLCSYYLLEARDHEAPFGAPESGVVIYHVTYDRDAGHPVVEVLSCQSDDAVAFSAGSIYERSTLHGANERGGAQEYVIAGGVVVRLLAESFSPYRATVRVERYQGD